MESEFNSQIRYLTRREAADFLTERGFRTAPSYLAKLACWGGGPEFRKFGARALYEPDELLKWAESRLSKPMNNTSAIAVGEEA